MSTDYLFITTFPELEAKILEDFLLVYKRVLHLYFDENGKNVILNVYELASNGTKFSDEFAEFPPQKKLGPDPPLPQNRWGAPTLLADIMKKAYICS